MDIRNMRPRPASKIVAENRKLCAHTTCGDYHCEEEDDEIVKFYSPPATRCPFQLHWTPGWVEIRTKRTPSSSHKKRETKIRWDSSHVPPKWQLPEDVSRHLTGDGCELEWIIVADILILHKVQKDTGRWQESLVLTEIFWKSGNG